MLSNKGRYHYTDDIDVSIALLMVCRAYIPVLCEYTLMQYAYALCR